MGDRPLRATATRRTCRCRRWTTTTSCVAWRNHGEDLTPEHGWPLRLVVPKRYAWKSAKWLTGLEFTDANRRGFWEVRGYHVHAEPFAEERYSLPGGPAGRARAVRAQATNSVSESPARTVVPGCDVLTDDHGAAACSARRRTAPRGRTPPPSPRPAGGEAGERRRRELLGPLAHREGHGVAVRRLGRPARATRPSPRRAARRRRTPGRSRRRTRPSRSACSACVLGRRRRRRGPRRGRGPCYGDRDGGSERRLAAGGVLADDVALGDLVVVDALDLDRRTRLLEGRPRLRLEPAVTSGSAVGGGPERRDERDGRALLELGAGRRVDAEDACPRAPGGRSGPRASFTANPSSRSRSVAASTDRPATCGIGVVCGIT